MSKAREILSKVKEQVRMTKLALLTAQLIKELELNPVLQFVEIRKVLDSKGLLKQKEGKQFNKAYDFFDKTIVELRKFKRML